MCSSFPSTSYAIELQRRVSSMSIRETREVLGVMRDASTAHRLDLLEHMLIPKYGMTVGEFATAYVLGLPARTKRATVVAAAPTM